MLMTIKPVKVNTKDEFDIQKHPTLSPSHGSMMTNALIYAMRGGGKLLYGNHYV